MKPNQPLQPNCHHTISGFRVPLRGPGMIFGGGFTNWVVAGVGEAVTPNWGALAKAPTFPPHSRPSLIFR